MTWWRTGKGNMKECEDSFFIKPRVRGKLSKKPPWDTFLSFYAEQVPENHENQLRNEIILFKKIWTNGKNVQLNNSPFDFFPRRLPCSITLLIEIELQLNKLLVLNVIIRVFLWTPLFCFFYLIFLVKVMAGKSMVRFHLSIGLRSEKTWLMLCRWTPFNQLTYIWRFLENWLRLLTYKWNIRIIYVVATVVRLYSVLSNYWNINWF